MKSILDKSFAYTNAADSSKPGYLRDKFDRIKREQAKAAEQAKIVVPINQKQRNAQ